MSKMINIGIVGAGRRGESFKLAFQATGGFKIHAVCERNEEKLEAARMSFGAAEAYADFDEMTRKSEIQAVFIGTPMHFHAPQSVAALKRDLHVLSEVPAAVSIEECEALVNACKTSKGIYMMAENACYLKQNELIRELVHKGIFGETYYAEGEYLHNLKEMNEITVWRRKWQTGINGITYGTHSLGPILQWMPGDRVTSVCCAGSGHHYKDPRGNFYENEDSCVMLGKMVRGGLVKVRMDMISDRPDATSNYFLQGIDGAYESARARSESGKICLRSFSKNTQEWMDLKLLEKDYLPGHWSQFSKIVEQVGHSGSDFFVLMDFLNVILGRKPCPIGIHEAMDMTLPGLMSQDSIQQDGKWLAVPDSREW